VKPGVVDLRDLGGVRAWDTPRIAAVATGAGEPRQRFAPPPVVVAIAPVLMSELVERSRAWLDDAAHVILVRVHDVEIPDEDVRALADDLWREVMAGFGRPCELFDDLAAALDRAVTLAAITRDPIAPSPARALVEHPGGPRFSFARPDGWRNLAEVLHAQLAGTTLHTGDGAFSLHDPPAHVSRLPLRDRHVAVAPDGRLAEFGERTQLAIGEERFVAYGVLPLGFDANHPVGWTGHRMHTFWLYRGRRGWGYLCGTDHDWPCGPAKKLYGSRNNYPRWVDLAPDLSLSAHHYDHDVLVTSATPVRWRTADRVDVADFPHDPQRVVYFAQTEASIYELEDEDARELAPVLVLGGAPEAAYAIDLRHRVYRVTAPAPGEGRWEPVGGGADGFAVFDRAHREVRRASGRLLGGWCRKATVAERGYLWREDLVTGDRRMLEEVEGEILCAVGLPGTANVVVVTEDGERLYAQLV
jgi:hypothetical protein